MKHRLLAVLAVVALAVALPVQAQLTVQITQGVEDPIPVAVVPFGWDSAGAAPHDVAATVAADLERSGRFRALPRGTMIDFPQSAAQVDAADWRLLKVDYVVVGRLLPRADGRFDVQYELVNVLTGQRLLGQSLPADAGALKRAAHRVSDAVFERILGLKGAFATRIAYVEVQGRAPSRTFRLMVADADGANPRVVVQSSQPIMSPAWSPDGGSLAYVSFEGGVSAVFVQMLSSGQRVRVSARAGINGAPVFSPDGRRLALALSRRDGNVDVYLLELSDQSLTRLTDSPAIDTEPAFSPDGRFVYFTSDRGGGPQVYRAATTGATSAERVTFEGPYNARPRVAPDGRSLAVVTLDRGAYRIATVDLDRRGSRVLTTGRLDEAPSFAPNGAMIIYATREGGRGVLATTSVDGRVQQRLAGGAGEIREPAWSPFLP
ncbi:MAG: Tol-Pal system beta propeller repeat protein TolB [Steroidobacteraceae bacterium]|jgi:TolB protein|nr:Tol-Pal system beta propeller repeat protein TolB [Steroidobacteraceae bacterium]